MDEKFYVYFVRAKSYAGPFYCFEAAFSHLVRFGKEARIETGDDKVLATWSPWTGLFKVGVKYRYLVVDNEFNRTNHPDIVGQTFDEAPSFAMVQEIEAAS
jgi:hypothetical protein